jgi:uncharacterized protein YndB with AHSA1/START domain
MPSVEASVLVRRPGEEVFAFVADPRNLSRWQAALVRLEGLTGAPIQVGSSWIEVRRVGPRESTVTVKVTEFDPPRSFGWVGDAGILRVEGRFDFEGVADGTRVTQRMNFVGRGVMVLLSPVIARQSRHRMQHSLERLSRELVLP